MADLEILRVPNFEYSGMYFPQIAARLRRYARIYSPEITNEDRRELAIQMERSFSLMAHYNNVLMDMVANEMYLETARLPESVKLLLNLINYRMLPASPARVDLLGTLTRDYTTSTRLLDNNRKFATKRTPDDPEIVFETTEALDTTARTDQITDAYGLENESTCFCATSSVYPDILTYSSGTQWSSADINKYIQISGSELGNNTDDLRIIELLDETSPGSGVYNQIRVEGGSFISESSLKCTLRGLTANQATAWNTGAGVAVFSGNPIANDKIYFGHADVMWDRFDVTLSSGTPSIIASWEFFDDSETTYHPDSITVDPTPGVLRFELTSFLGAEEQVGALVKVMYLPTGAVLNDFTTVVGGLNVVDIEGYLGQTTPSTTPTDYLVFADWRPVSILFDTTESVGVTLDSSGYISFDLPQDQNDKWQKKTIYNKDASESRAGYFLRYRVCENPGAAAAPVVSTISINNGEKYILTELIQGKTVEDDPLGSSSGNPNEEFTLNQSPYIYQSVRVFVDEGGGDIEWTEVDTFLTSYSIDRHFIVDIQTNGNAIVKFGDGVNGRIPPTGANNIRAIYRIGADDDGNIGANTLTVNRDGVGVFKTITNPRIGEFWVEADWASQDSLERVKEAGPLKMRTMYRAVTARDCEILARSFINQDGVKPVARARAYEEAFGPKTIELVVAGWNGASLSASYKEELAEFFNGGDDYGGVLVTNHELTVSNYIPKSIGYTMEVTANAVVTEELVLQTLSSLLSPTALQSNKRSYVWQFGQEVPNSRIIAEVFKVSPGNVFKVDITSPSDDISLANNELPVLDVSSTNIVIVSPDL